MLVPDSAAADAHLTSWVVHVAGLPRVPGRHSHHQAPAHGHLAGQHVLVAAHPAKRGDARDAQSRRSGRHRDHRRLHRRGLHLEAAIRHRGLHHLWPLHVGLPGQYHRQAARPARDRPQGRRGGCHQRRGFSTGEPGRGDRHRGPLGAPADPARGGVVPALPVAPATRSARSTSRSSTASSTSAVT